MTDRIEMLAKQLEDRDAHYRRLAPEGPQTANEAAAQALREMRDAPLRIDVKQDGVWLIGEPKSIGKKGAINLAALIDKGRRNEETYSVAEHAILTAIKEARQALQGVDHDR